jgi:hypothetical protein
VNAAASSDSQPKGVREGRAAHVTAKATDSTRIDRSECWTSPGYGRWHASTGRCGTGETLPGSQRQAQAPRVRRDAEIAESREGVRGARSTDEGRQENLPEGRSPASVVAVAGRKREGMGESPNTPDDKAREVTDSLWVTAKRQKAQSVSEGRTGCGDVHTVPATPWPTAVHAASGRPSVSRMLENCTYGLKGGCWRRAA